MSKFKKLIVVIIAGGKGERLWPKSVPSKPKQFCEITSDQSMIRDTYDRYLAIVPEENIYLSVNQDHQKLIKKSFPKLSKKNLILEPTPRDTACAILLAIKSIPCDDESVFLFSPADHFIKDVKKFKSNIENALKVTNATSNMTLLGIQPTSPSSSYGYIKAKKNNNTPKELGKIKNYFLIDKFVEKPDETTAKKFLKTGNYFWNSGLFMFKAGHLLALYSKHMTEDLKRIDNYLNWFKKNPEKAKKEFMKITKISFDYAIVEKLSNINCIAAEFDWDDVGNWDALYRIKKNDKYGNVISDKVQVFETESTICQSDNDQKIVFNGVQNLIVINTNDYLYITHKSKVQNIKALLKKIN